MSTEIPSLLATRFIARRDVKAIQHSNGIYTPHTRPKRSEDEPLEYLPWQMTDLEAHLSGSSTFGHYFLNQNSECKLFMFDIDLCDSGFLPEEKMPDPWASDADQLCWEIASINACADLRSAWRDRSHPGRPWMKRQFKQVAHKLVKTIMDEIAMPCAVAYSGSKGIHVYAFTGPISGYNAREGARIVLDALGETEPSKGNNFYRFKNQDNIDGFPNLSIEVFPKQDTIDADGFGNLVRLPLGRNLKNPKDPTFFVDMSDSLNSLSPVDPLWALTDGAANPFRKPGE